MVIEKWITCYSFSFSFFSSFLSFFLSFKRRMADCVLVMGHCGILEANTHV
jgi:hypothetical protein